MAVSGGCRVKKKTGLTVIEGNNLQLGLFHLTATGLEITGRPTFEEWQLCGDALARMEGSVQFWLGDWVNYGEKGYGEKYAQAISPTQADTWKHYAWVSNSVEKCTRVHDLSWAHHREIAKFSKTPDVQRELLEKGRGTTVTEFKTIVREYTHGAKVAAIQAGAVATGEYDIVCADPPWAYSNSGFEQSAADHYPTMDVEAICRLPQDNPTFPKFADPCVLFLWATNPLLPEAFAVLSAWDFTYKASLVWVKDRAPGLGWWLKTRHELLLIAVKGSASPPLERVDSVISAAVSAHSRKPVEAYKAIDSMFPGLRRVELFARSPRDGWDVWGNEV